MTAGAVLPTNSDLRHATTVAIDGRAVLIEGPSGSGKSALALQLIAIGAVLVADDRTRLMLREGWPWACAPERLAGVIEARGVGLIHIPHLAAAPLAVIIDMATAETARLPQTRKVPVFGHEILHLRRVDAPHFPSAICALVKGGISQNA